MKQGNYWVQLSRGTWHYDYSTVLNFKHKLPHAHGMQSNVSLLIWSLNPKVSTDPLLYQHFNAVGMWATSQGIVLNGKGLDDSSLRPWWGLDWHNVPIQRGQGSGSHHPAWSLAACRADSSKALVHNTVLTLAWTDCGDELLQISSQVHINRWKQETNKTKTSN